ncbi:MAG: TetR/AcrR family transcriptional regulator [Candidatus Phaeomarinobacter sp.]
MAIASDLTAAPTTSVSGLRARQKSDRLNQILDVAEELIDTHGEAAVTTEAIAAAAGFSAPTIYNLAGTREELLTSIMVRSMLTFRREVEALTTGTPLERGAKAVRICTGIFLSRERLYKEVVIRLGGPAGVGGPHAGPTPDRVQIELMTEADAAGMFVKGTAPDVVGRQIFMSFIGALSVWAADRMVNAAFEAQTLHGYYAAVHAYAADPHRTKLEKLMRQQARKLAQLPQPA